MNVASLALVAAQFLLIVLLASPLGVLLTPRTFVEIAGLALLLAGIALALAAATAMRATRFSVLPEPRSGGTLIERGPYRLVRHPMYSAVLLCGFGACLVHGDTLHWLWLAAIGVVLWLKIRREERLLLATYPGYADYRRRVRAVVPALL